MQCQLWPAGGMCANPGGHRACLYNPPMLDRPLDVPDNNFGGIALVAGDGMLCLAPHPDDEVLGCAGLLMLAHAQGLRVHTIIVTAGEKGLEPSPPGYPSPSGNLRLAESYAAARILGLEPPVCWHLADRELRHAPPLIDAASSGGHASAGPFAATRAGMTRSSRHAASMASATTTISPRVSKARKSTRITLTTLAPWPWP